MQAVWEGSGYAFCESRSGDRHTWPAGIDRQCPLCERDFVLDDYLALVEEEGQEVLYHNTCLEAEELP